MSGPPPARPTTSSARPTTAFGAAQNHNKPYEIEEEYEEESDDEDVFAFLPPTTAEQQQEQQQQREREREREAVYDNPSPFSHNPFVHQAAAPQYPDPTFDPWGRQQPPPQVPTSPGRAPILVSSASPVNFSRPGTAAAAFTPQPSQHPYSNPIHSRQLAPSVIGPPPLSPPSPSTDSQPSTGQAGQQGMGMGDLYRLKRMGVSKEDVTDRRQKRSLSKDELRVNLPTTVPAVADSSSDTLDLERDARPARSLSLTKDPMYGRGDTDADITLDGNKDTELHMRDVEADLPTTHYHPHQEMTRRRNGKRVSRGERGTAGSEGQRLRNPNAQPYWSYAQNAREFATLYGPGGGRGGTAASSGVGTSTTHHPTTAFSSDTRDAHGHHGGYDGRGLSTGDGSYITHTKRTETVSYADTLSMTHSMMEDDEGSIK